MVEIPAGEFQMGAPRSEVDSGDIERPRHLVRIAQSFAISRFEITLRQYTAFVDATGYKGEGSCHVWVGSNWENQPGRSWRDPGFYQTPDHPVVCVSWNDARAYVAWLSRQSGKHYRLPTESEWEYIGPRRHVNLAFLGRRSGAGPCEYGNVHDATTLKSRQFAWDAHDCRDGFVLRV